MWEDRLDRTENLNFFFQLHSSVYRPSGPRRGHRLQRRSPKLQMTQSCKWRISSKLDFNLIKKKFEIYRKKHIFCRQLKLLFVFLILPTLWFVFFWNENIKTKFRRLKRILSMSIVNLLLHFNAPLGERDSPTK